MPSTVRIPAALEADARSRCQRLGISFNALVCVALDAYLRAAEPRGADLAPAGIEPLPVPAAALAEPGLTRKQRRRLEAERRKSGP